LSFAVIVSRVMGLNDPRTYGSGNPGATQRAAFGEQEGRHPHAGLRCAQGFVPVLLVTIFGRRFGLGEGTVALVGLAAFLGHVSGVLPLRRWQGRGHRGGRAAGHRALARARDAADLAIIAFFFRYSSLAAIVAAVFAPFYQLLIWGGGRSRSR